MIEETVKQMAIMKGVGFGLRDVGTPVLFFSTYLTEGEAALQVLFYDEYVNFIKKYGVYDVKELEGRPVWVDVDGCIIDVNSPCII